MLERSRQTLSRTFRFLTGLLVLKIILGVLLSYRDYFPANFNSEFLSGRESYFAGSYQWAFYAHVLACPLSLLLGLLLASDALRRRAPRWHRRLGRVQGVNVLFLVAPSGFVMAFHAVGGAIAGAGFVCLALATAASMVLGWKAAVQRRFQAHERWMTRSFVLLCSAVVIRLIGGLAVSLEYHASWIDPAAAWACWLVPLVAFEIFAACSNGRSSQRAIALTPANYSIGGT